MLSRAGLGVGWIFVMACSRTPQGQGGANAGSSAAPAISKSASVHQLVVTELARILLPRAG